MENKKNKSIDHVGKRPMFICIGLCTSLTLVFSAFQIRAINEPEVIPSTELGFNDEVIIPITEFEKKEPPKPKDYVVIPIDDDLEILEVEIEIDNTFNSEDQLEDVFSDVIIDEEPVESEFMVVEELASFPGGFGEWGKFLQDNMKYPKLAKRSGIEGKVQLAFVVAADGTISDIEVLRGIGGGCDEEAKRVLEMSPKWNPGLQRGNPVKSRMSIFIHFVLK